jgi:hypothetical protein
MCFREGVSDRWTGGIVAFILWLLIGPSAVPAQRTPDLKDLFKDPPREFSMEPLWSWNGTLERDKLVWQIDQMMEKGVYGAYMHARDGLDQSRTPYFSDGFRDAVKTSVEHAEKVGLRTWIYDEDKWPSGDAGGRTRAANPERFTARGLTHRTQSVRGPAELKLDYENAVFVIAAKRTGEEAIEKNTLIDLTTQNRSKETWRVPEGEWLISIFEPVHMKVPLPNYINPDAVREFLNNTYEQYAKRFSRHFGTTIPGSFFDEIYNVTPVPWDPLLEQRFRTRKGYELRKFLPLLFLDGGRETVKFRCDFFEEFARLYEEAWFEQLSAWCASHNLKLTGHTNEDIRNIFDQGDYFRTWRHAQMPGTDNEDFRYTWPRTVGAWKPKQLSSVAHVYGKPRAMAESLGGAGWTVTLDQARYGVNMLAVYGINSFVMHLFHYSLDTAVSQDDWPNSWFYQNPYWKYFKRFADYTRRLSFLGSQGEHVANIAVLYPVEDVWSRGPGKRQQEHAVTSLIDHLQRSHMDCDLVDTDSVAATSPRIGTEDYRVLILPDVRTVSARMYARVAERARQGLTVVALGAAPRNSSENGAEDPAVLKISAGIRVFKDLDELTSWLRESVPADITIEGEGAPALRYLHRRVADKDIYFLVNSERRPVSVKVHFAAKGEAEKWNPETGEASPINPANLSFAPWEAYYIVFGGRTKTAPLARSPGQTEIALNGPWTFQVVPHELDYNWSPDPGETKVNIPVGDFRIVGHPWQRIRFSNGTRRYVSDWDAVWITRYVYETRHPGQFGGPDLKFSRELDIPFDPASASIEVQAKGAVECLWDGTPVSNLNAIPAAKGRHRLEFRVRGEGFLLAQGAIKGKAGEAVAIRTDRTWTVDDQQAYEVAPPPPSDSKYPVEVEYRIPVPPGCVLENGKPAFRITLNKPGDGLNDPPVARCGKAEFQLQDWSNQNLDWYSGRGIYTTTFDAPVGRTVTLDLGEICYTGEVWLNGELAGTLVWPPYRIDISKQLKPGRNTLTVIAANLLANEMRWNRFESGTFSVNSRWWHDGNILRDGDKLRSGLIGPVKLLVAE